MGVEKLSIPKCTDAFQKMNFWMKAMSEGACTVLAKLFCTHRCPHSWRQPACLLFWISVFAACRSLWTMAAFPAVSMRRASVMGGMAPDNCKSRELAPAFMASCMKCVGLTSTTKAGVPTFKQLNRCGGMLSSVFSTCHPMMSDWLHHFRCRQNHWTDRKSMKMAFSKNIKNLMTSQIQEVCWC